MIPEEQLQKLYSNAKEFGFDGIHPDETIALIEEVRTLAYDLRHTEAALQRFEDGSQVDFRITLEHLIIKLRKELKEKDELIAKKNEALRIAADYIHSHCKTCGDHSEICIEIEAALQEKSG